MKKALLLLLVGVLFAPMLSLISVGVLVNPAVTNQAMCIASGVVLGPVPDQLEVTTRDGTMFTLNRQQLTHAATIIETGARTPGVGQGRDHHRADGRPDRVHPPAAGEHRRPPRVGRLPERRQRQ